MKTRLNLFFLASICLPFLFVLGCGNANSSFVDDPNSQSPGSSAGTCNPQISDLAFAQGEWEGIGYFIRVSFSYKLKCNSAIEDGEIYVKVTNMDMSDPNSADAYAEYVFDTSDSKYVDASGSRSVKVDFKIGSNSTTTTFDFQVKLKDSGGYWSNALNEEVVYEDITDSVDDE